MSKQKARQKDFSVSYLKHKLLILVFIFLYVVLMYSLALSHEIQVLWDLSFLKNGVVFVEKA